MNCTFIPIITPQMFPIIQKPQQIPHISAYCQCGQLNPGRSLTKTQTSENATKKKQEPCLPRTKRIRSYNETNTESSNSEMQLKKVRLTDLPRKQNRKNKVLQRLSSLGSGSKIFQEIESISNPEEVIIKASAKCQTARTEGLGMRSKYIGVCHKKGMYNAYIVANGKKTYICGTKNEEITARYYDYCAILLHGRAATTNFSYTKRQLMEMLASERICSES
ncbi:unnamed protein product [Moneuplotes crassus]|uniref:AP2/ERF domain-containing protein n=1 Tax=Euplotes crassus TaxID=5936 RepID=A0AAD1Y3D0_EUPCR|nr:unnamed protein product [Moneuplotes crassus]